MLTFVRCCLLPAIKLYLLGLWVLLGQLFSKTFRLPEMPRQEGKVAIVTGGSRGIGFEVALHLAGLGAHVIIGGRDEQEGLSAVAKIREEHREAKVEFITLDLGSMQSVRHFVQCFKERNLPLNILVNNAGIMLVPEGRTEDGFELHFGVNYLGHFLLTWLLLDHLKQSGMLDCFSRVVHVSSSAHRIGEIKLNDLNSEYYSAHAAYCQSKLAQLLFSAHLQKALRAGAFTASSFAVDPGMVHTALYRHIWAPLRLALGVVAQLLFWTPKEGAATVLYAALSPALDGERAGGYWANGRRQMTSPPTSDLRLQRSLWETSARMLGLQ
uniref:Dehydrogenase/reductase X-linked n=1 Tax=Neogobius melanostomus TaxID=47308 RepID=A0A8C6T0P7_9GOBI